MALAETFTKEVVPQLKKDLKISNVHAVPRIKRVVVNARIKNTVRSDKFIESLSKTIERITGQKPVITKAKKSISSFKIRQGMEVGLKVTLRGKRMYDFLERLVNITLPRVRDFQGLPTSAFGKSGCYTIGFKEHIVFPEIRSDEVEQIHGLQVTIITTAKDPVQGEALLRAIGFPLTDKRNDN
jgi:large subunit ribosomal protein L5